MSIRSANSTRLGRKMSSRSSATAFDRLAPDQRAAVELVLRQGRSYGELADLLGMPEETIRTRARNGLTGLAPDLPAPARAGEIADWLLGQQSEAHAARTRALVLADPSAQTWAATVAGVLRAGRGGAAVPALPTGPDDAAPPRVNGTAVNGHAGVGAVAAGAGAAGEPRHDADAAGHTARGAAGEPPHGASAAGEPAGAGGEPPPRAGPAREPAGGGAGAGRG